MSRFRVFHLGIALALCLAAGDALAEPGQWARWLQGRLAELPDSRAIQARVEAELARSRALSQPLYNPSVIVDYENSAENTGTVGLSQTLDWSGKGSAAEAVGEVAAELARVTAERDRARLATAAIDALIAWDAARQRLAAAHQQEQRLQRLTGLIHRRESSGDLGRVEATLIYLALARVQEELAAAESQAVTAETALRQVLAVPQPVVSLPAPERWRAVAEPRPQQYLDHNYAVRLAGLRARLAERGVTLAARERHTDPTIGVRAGREGEATLWGVEVAMPLPLFNSGVPEYQAALADAEGQRAGLERQRRWQQAALEGAWRDYQQRRDRWRQWRDRAAPLTESDALLERVWRQGEWTTQEYLQGLDRQLQARLAGVNLREAMQHAWLRWLYQSATLGDWLNGLAGGSGGGAFLPITASHRPEGNS